MPRRRACLAAALAFAGGLTVAQAGELTVSAAASLAGAFRDIGAAYDAQHPGSRVLLNIGASGALLRQLAQGAPADVFASADALTMDEAQQQKLIEASARRVFARNRLVLVVPADAESVPTALADLLHDRWTRIALGVPASVPAGRYAKEALERAGLWASLAPRMVGAISVRQALDYVARSEVDAGFVYATDAALMPLKVKVAFTVATATPVAYPIAPVAGSTRSAEASRFVAFVLSPPAQAILAKHGFAGP